MYSLLREEPTNPARSWEYGRTPDELRRQGLSGKLLDYCAGDGAFLGHLPGGWQKCAVEPSLALRFALAESGVECFVAHEAAAALPSGLFDVITMFQVLEHLAEFADVLTWCRGALRPGGRLFASVSEGERHREWEAATGLSNMPPLRVNQSTRSSLATAL